MFELFRISLYLKVLSMEIGRELRLSIAVQTFSKTLKSFVVARNRARPGLLARKSIQPDRYKNAYQ